MYQLEFSLSAPKAALRFAFAIGDGGHRLCNFSPKRFQIFLHQRRVRSLAGELRIRRADGQHGLHQVPDAEFQNFLTTREKPLRSAGCSPGTIQFPLRGEMGPQGICSAFFVWTPSFIANAEHRPAAIATLECGVGAYARLAPANRIVTAQY